MLLVFDRPQDEDYGLQEDIVGYQELPGTRLLKGFPLQALDEYATCCSPGRLSCPSLGR